MVGVVVAVGVGVVVVVAVAVGVGVAVGVAVGVVVGVVVVVGVGVAVAIISYMKNPAAVALGRLTWQKKPRKLKSKKYMKALSKKGVAARAAKRSVDKQKQTTPSVK